MGMKNEFAILFSFLVSLKSEACPLSRRAVTPISENNVINIGMIRIQAFQKPHSKAGINDTISL